MRYRPRRHVLENAIEIASRSQKGKAVIHIAHNRSPDQAIYESQVVEKYYFGAWIVLKKAEQLRESDETRRWRAKEGEKENLRAIVARAAVASGLHYGDRYALELILMAYYGLLKKFVAARRKKFELRKQELRRNKGSLPLSVPVHVLL